jgi:hypothetical protein
MVMFGRNRNVLMAVTVAALIGAPGAADAAQFAQRRSVEIGGGWQAANRDAYDRGYREGLQRGERDAERGRDDNVTDDSWYRDGDRGYNQRYGSRDAYRDAYRGGFESGYRAGYGQVRGIRVDQGRRNSRVTAPRGARGYQEPAFARGYADGFDKGLEDGRDRDRYDPVRHSDYREADQGYSGSYGSKDAYKNNYRAGFRQGYEDGYRDAARNRR